ncbi:unnamed protein product [Lupinus luteus]|uniref:Transcription repressor n=1 Tax=Lupinus luteus TaxID=3873 RepID=A0AAV1XWH5_LUPLU
MPKKIRKSLQNYLSKIKIPRSKVHIPSKQRTLSVRKHRRTSSFVNGDITPKASSFSMDDKKNNDKDVEATLTDIDHFLLENFKSLYIKDDEEKVHDDEEEEEESHENGNKFPKLRPFIFKGAQRDRYGSNRFNMKRNFSDSLEDTTIGDQARSSTTSITTTNDSSPSNSYYTKDQDMEQIRPNKCIVILGCSPNPYEDFHRSMQNMVEAKLKNNESVDWDFMEQLLFFHMNMNEKKSYKFILSAFVDLVTDMRPPSETTPAMVNPKSVRTLRSGKKVK